MLILKLALLFTLGLGVGYCLKQVSWLLFIWLLALIASTAVLIGFLIFMYIFFHISFQSPNATMNSGAFTLGLLIGYFRTKAKWAK
jgi:hypothetical protein